MHPSAREVVRPQKNWAWVVFALMGVLIGASFWGLGFARGSDAAKTTLWWFTLTASSLVLARAHSPKLTRWTWMLMTTFFVLDCASQGVIRGFFGVSPQPNVLAEALANTNTAEASGFVMEQRWPIFKGLAWAICLMLLGWQGRKVWAEAPKRPYSRPAFWGMAALMTFTVLLHFNPSMLGAQPFLRWGVLFSSHAEAQKEIQAFENQRKALWRQHAAWDAHLVDQRPHTVVVFIGESDNRLNWHLLGYPRDTTQPLQEAFEKLPGQVTLFSNATSQQAFTLPSLKLALTPATSEQPDLWKTTPDITFMAKEAGFYTRWLSNQPSNDGWFAAIARDADEKVFINNGNWRDSSSVDRDLVKPLRKMLSQAARPYELIVIHLLGQHFHYELRCPKGIGPFSGVDDDPVMQDMKRAGRKDSIRQSRNEYDNAVYCGAQANAEMLQAISELRNDRKISVLYFSDHGQEVGHNRNFSGHSEQDASGYSIPMWLWNYQPGQKPQKIHIETKKFPLEYADQAMQHLLGIHSKWYEKKSDPLSAAFNAEAAH
ncbi:hypothetical protein B9Z51_11570 [Limnohabitans sp. T6-5]|nr:hypothetical protein B9Z51_11570 [Limnohabitans sp. T6-5]